MPSAALLVTTHQLSSHISPRGETNTVIFKLILKFPLILSILFLRYLTWFSPFQYIYFLVLHPLHCRLQNTINILRDGARIYDRVGRNFKPILNFKYIFLFFFMKEYRIIGMIFNVFEYSPVFNLKYNMKFEIRLTYKLHMYMVKYYILNNMPI